MSNQNDDKSKLEELRRQQAEQQRERQNEELRRINEQREREAEAYRNQQKGKPLDERPKDNDDE